MGGGKWGAGGGGDGGGGGGRGGGGRGEGGWGGGSRVEEGEEKWTSRRRTRKTNLIVTTVAII